MSFWWRMWSRRLITAVISSQHWSWLQSKVNESCGSQKRLESQLHVQGGFCIEWRMLYWGWRWICIRNLTYGYEPCLVGSCNEQKADCMCSRASCEGLRSSANQGPQRRAGAAPQTMVKNLKNVILSLNKSLLCTCDRTHGCQWSRASASHVRQTLLTSGKKISTSDQRQPHRQNMRVWRIDFK